MRVKLVVNSVPMGDKKFTSILKVKHKFRVTSAYQADSYVHALIDFYIACTPCDVGLKTIYGIFYNHVASDMDSSGHKVPNGYSEFVKTGRVVHVLIYNMKSREFFYLLLELVSIKV